MGPWLGCVYSYSGDALCVRRTVYAIVPGVWLQLAGLAEAWSFPIRERYLCILYAVCASGLREDVQLLFRSPKGQG